MLSKKFATILLGLSAVGMLSACNNQPHDSSVDVALFFTPLDWFLLGCALVSLFLLPVAIIYWPKRSLN